MNSLTEHMFSENQTNKKAMIFGAGQAGRMVALWLPGNCSLSAYIDNNKNLQGQIVNGIPVLSPEEALLDPANRPDLIWLAVLNKEAGSKIEEQLLSLGYEGEVLNVITLRNFMDIRLAALRLIASSIKERNVEGSVAELGVYRGAFAREINSLFPGRSLYLFDTFEGFDERDLVTERFKASDGKNASASVGYFGNTSVDSVKSVLPHPAKAVFIKGRFPDSLSNGPKELDTERFALVSLDTDLYMPTLEGLKFFYPRLSKGGAILIHDYTSTQFPGVKRAATNFMQEAGIFPVPLMDMHGTAVIIKQGDT